MRCFRPPPLAHILPCDAPPPPLPHTHTHTHSLPSQIIKRCREAMDGKGLTDRELKQSCDDMGRYMMDTRGLLAQCWNYEEAPGFCGCIVAGGLGRKKEC